MHTVKDEAVAVISNLPETVDIDGIIEELEHHFRQEKETTVQETTQATKTIPVSCLDLARKYIGCVEGPADLSTNKAYFNGFGE